MALACGFCHALYRADTPHSRERVELCCVCAKCKVNLPKRTGFGGVCEECGLKSTIAHNEKYLADLQRTLDSQHDQLKRLEERKTKTAKKTTRRRKT